jgi:hypothetical protein
MGGVLEIEEIQPLYHMIIHLLLTPLVDLLVGEVVVHGHTGLIIIKITGVVAGMVRVIPYSLTQRLVDGIQGM